jgi:hypothetical protein
MPRKVTTTVYQYNELSDAAKRKALNWFRDLQASNMDNSWAQPVQEEFKETAAHMGWSVTGMWWSGFENPGDGAQFEGDWSATRVNEEALKRDCPLINSATGERINEQSYKNNESLRSLAQRYASFAAENPEATATVKQSGDYAHSRANKFEFSNVGAQEFFIRISRELMDRFYIMLGQQYSYAISDDHLTKEMVEKELTFKKDGKHFS